MRSRSPSEGVEVDEAAELLSILEERHRRGKLEAVWPFLCPLLGGPCRRVRAPGPCLAPFARRARMMLICLRTTAAGKSKKAQSA